MTLPPEDLSGDKLLATLKKDADGRPVLGDYTLLRRIGVGGMGAVYYGVHPRLKREVAIKILPFHLVDQEPALVKRFLAEARMAAALESDHVVQVLDVGEDNGTHYFVMQYVSGESAGAMLKRMKAGGRAGLPERDAMDIVISAAKGLALAHQKGIIIHRDVKPDNILIPTGKLSRAKIADLGLAKPEGSAHTYGTISHIAMGTPGYMAPEQAEDARAAGPQADVFALGSTFYALLSGRAPFGGASPMAAMRAAAEEEPPPLPKAVSPAVLHLIGRCMQKDPTDRYPDCIALLGALERVAADPIGCETPSERKPGAPKRKYRMPGQTASTSSSKPWIAAGAAAALVLVVFGVIVATRRPPTDDPSETPPPTKPPTERGDSDKARCEQAARDAAVEQLLKEADRAEEAGRLDEAMAKAGEALRLDAESSRAKEARLRIEGRMAAAKEADRRKPYLDAVEDANRLTKEAEKTRTSTAWQGVLDAVKRAQSLAVTDEDRAECANAVTATSARREFALAREAETAGDLEKALACISRAIDIGGPMIQTFRAYKEALEKRKSSVEDRVGRKKQYDERAAEAAAEPDPSKAIGLWKRALEVADDSKDRDSAQGRVDALTAAADVEKRYQEAMKGADAALTAGRLDESTAKYKEALQLKAADAAATAGLAKADAARLLKLYEASMAEAKALDQNREWENAKAAYEKALAAKPGDAAAKRAIAEAEKNRKSSRRSVSLDADGKIKMEFALIKAGTFTMGDKRGESNTAPHEVTLTKDFWMATTETTQLQWDAVMGKDKNLSFHKGADLPVENVSFDDAIQFTKKLNLRFKADLSTLPTEAEWEYAFKANAKTLWPGGDEVEKCFDYGWSESNSGGETHPVAQKKPNPWGLYDMGGNIWEWNLDMTRDYKGKCTDPVGPTTTSGDRSIRGGSAIDHPDRQWFSRRNGTGAGNRGKNVGFRVVLH